MDLDERALRRVSDLTTALERECRLIAELHRAVLSQREAVARGDGSAVEASIVAAGRALLTLQETRRSRAALLEGLVGDPSQPLSGLEAHFDPGLPVSFIAALREVQQSAIAVRRDIRRNEEWLAGALKARDALVQELLTGSRPESPPEAPFASREEA
jgi:hypothetical protein